MGQSQLVEWGASDSSNEDRAGVLSTSEDVREALVEKPFEEDDAEEEADPTDRLSDHTAAEPLEAADREEETENDAGGEPTEPSSKKHRAGPS